MTGALISGFVTSVPHCFSQKTVYNFSCLLAFLETEVKTKPEEARVLLVSEGPVAAPYEGKCTIILG